MARNLTRNDNKFVREYVEHGNGTEAAEKAYGIDDPNYAGVKATRMLRKDKIKKKLKSIADSIPDGLLIEKHLELLNSMEKVISEGEIISESINVQGVKAGLDMAYKLKGSYADEKIKVSGDVKIISFRDHHTDK